MENSVPAGGLLTVGQMAALLNVRPSWIYTKAATNDIPCIHVGRYLRFDPPAVLRWFKANRDSERNARP